MNKSLAFSKSFLLSCIGAFFYLSSLFAQATNQTVPDAQGKGAEWLSAVEQGVNTSNTLKSKVRYTL